MRLARARKPESDPDGCGASPSAQLSGGTKNAPTSPSTEPGRARAPPAPARWGSALPRGSASCLRLRASSRGAVLSSCPGAGDRLRACPRSASGAPRLRCAGLSSSRGPTYGSKPLSLRRVRAAAPRPLRSPFHASGRSSRTSSPAIGSLRSQPIVCFSQYHNPYTHVQLTHPLGRGFLRPPARRGTLGADGPRLSWSSRSGGATEPMDSRQTIEGGEQSLEGGERDVAETESGLLRRASGGDRIWQLGTVIPLRGMEQHLRI